MESLDKILQNFANEAVRKETLDNGLTVILKEDHAAEVASVQVWVKTGSIHEADYLGSGISHYVEHMLFKGTKKRNYLQISEDIQKVGGNVNAYTTFDRTVYHVDGTTEGADVAMEVLSDIVFNSVMDEAEALKERDVILREIDMGLDDPDRQLSQSMFKTAYQSHPYRFPVIGEKELFKQITIQDLRNYYQERYVPNNMVVVVVGAMDMDHMFSRVKHHFGHAQPRFLKPVLIQEESQQLSTREIRKTGDYEIVRGGMVFKIPSLQHPETPGLGILANVLGQGQSSYLWKRLREERGLVHYINASVWNPGTTGLFWIGYNCDKGKRAEVEKAIMEELFNFQFEGVTQDKLDKAIRQAMVGEVNSRKTMAGQAAKLALSEVVVGDLNYSRIFIEKLKTVTIEQIAQLQQKYLVDTTKTLVSLETKDEDNKNQAHVRSADTLPEFNEVKLDNGARLLLQPYSSVPKVNIRVLFLGGPLYEEPSKRGASTLLASMLTKDTQKRTTYQVAEAIEHIGGVFSEFSGNNSFGLIAEVLPQDIHLASELIKDAILQPDFKEESFQIEKEAQIAAIREELDEVAANGFRELRRRFFGDFPYAFDPAGTIETVQSLQLQDIEDYRQKLIQPSSMVVAISGDFDPSSIQEEFQWLNQLQHAHTPKPVAEGFSGPSSAEYETQMEREQVVVFQAFPGIGVHDTEYTEVAELLNELLSGMTSRLFVKVREEQAMAYFVGSSLMVGQKEGIFYFYGGTNPQQYEKVFKEFDLEVQRLIDGNITHEELDRCKIRLKSSHLMGLQAPASRAMIAGLDGLYCLDVNRWKSYASRLDQVSIQALQQFAQERFQPSNRVRLAIGNLSNA